MFFIKSFNIQSIPILSSYTSLFTRGSKYAKPKSKLPGYLLSKQSSKTSILKSMLKMRWHRLRKGKTGQLPRRPAYGYNDNVLSKMNI